MKRTDQPTHRRSRAPVEVAIAVAIAVLCLLATPTHSQETRIDPRHPSVAWLQEWGTIDGTNLQCLPGWYESFGQNIVPAGDLNHDHIGDFLLERLRCDTAFGPNKTTRGNEWLLFYGKKNQLPKPEEGIRIGPTEIGSVTTFLCTGDFDGDGYRDIVSGIHLYNDTSQGPTGRDVGMPVIFWGKEDGKYSTSDTTRLPCDAPLWITPSFGIGADINGDHIDDLIIQGTGSGFSRGSLSLVKIPKIYVFGGSKGKRWGRDGKDYAPVQRWWNPPKTSKMSYRDHDCSGQKDLIFHDKERAVEKISIAYQHDTSNWLDTTDIEMIDLWKANGRFVLFQDVSGDNVLDLVLIGGDFSNQRIKVFAGKAGQRLTEQYGDGWDSADIANKRFPLRPWVSMPTPTVLHDGWAGSEHVLFDLGDINADKRSEIVAHSSPFILIYTTGRTLDSLIDVMVNIPADSWGTFRRVGDIDGSGTASFAASWDGNVHFMKAPPVDEIPTYGGRLRDLPHPIDFRCQLSSGVDDLPMEYPQDQIKFSSRQIEATTTPRGVP
ncbi:MAG: hypothetical protein JNJ94_12165 [Chlorobi bacterium]|nr:hypothetical protein [Chlorobiota bacterium]